MFTHTSHFLRDFLGRRDMNKFAVFHKFAQLYFRKEQIDIPTSMVGKMFFLPYWSKLDMSVCFGVGGGGGRGWRGAI